MECPALCNQHKSMRNGLQAEEEEFLHWEWGAKRMNTPTETTFLFPTQASQVLSEAGKIPQK